MQTDEARPLFTVFTGKTYNRADYLWRVYRCLLAQTLQDFEWLIVDDGSTDDTKVQVDAMIAEAKITIRYFHKDNGGVHTAHNLAAKNADGEMFLRCDNDDEFAPEAMERLWSACQSIPNHDRKHYSGVSCLCMDVDGAVIGDPYPDEPWDPDWHALSNLRGEK